MKSKYRLGSSIRETEEWAVYNTNYSSSSGIKVRASAKPWVAYNPNQNVFYFATHSEAINHINKVEDGDIW